MTAVVGHRLLAKQLIGSASCQRRTVREKPALHIILSSNLSNFDRIAAITPCAFDSIYTSHIPQHFPIMRINQLNIKFFRNTAMFYDEK
jgi:hypothetical protein